MYLMVYDFKPVPEVFFNDRLVPTLIVLIHFTKTMQKHCLAAGTAGIKLWLK
jgi:hypothetical protein